MTTNKPEVVAWLRNERGEDARGPATFDPMCIFGSPEPQGLVASYSPVVMLSYYEALQVECEKLRKVADQYRRLIEMGEDFHWENIICVDISDFPSRAAAIAKATTGEVQ